MPTDLQRTTPETVARARAIRDEHRRRLTAIGVGGELLLTGGSSLPGLLTKGDVDLHLRVPAGELPAVVELLTTRYAAVHPEIWTDGFATFEEAADPPVGIAVTATGSEHDIRFRRGWDRLREDAAARDRYNAIKAGGVDAERRKSAFFDDV